MFQVGQLVRFIGCTPEELERIRAAFGRNIILAPQHGEILPKRGEYYRVRDIMVFGIEYILVQEIVNKPRYYRFEDGISRNVECPFRARYFSPVDDKKIEIFRNLLVNPPKELIDG